MLASASNATLSCRRLVMDRCRVDREDRMVKVPSAARWLLEPEQMAKASSHVMAVVEMDVVSLVWVLKLYMMGDRRHSAAVIGYPWSLRPSLDEARSWLCAGSDPRLSGWISEGEVEVVEIKVCAVAW